MTNSLDGSSVEELDEWEEVEVEGEEEESSSFSELEFPDIEENPVFAELPDKTGSLVLSGPGAGTALFARGGQPSSEVTTTTTSGLRDRDEALSSDAPLMLVHFPHQNRSAIPRLLASVVAATDGAVSMGVSVGLPQATTIAQTEWLDNCVAASIKIADPQGFRLDAGKLKVNPIKARSRGWMPYLTKDPLDAKEVLDAQRSVGANLLVSSGRAVDSADWQTSLDSAFADADEYLSELLPGERLALNLTISSQWLINETLRNSLFAQLLDQEQFDIWHIRVQWPSGLRAFSQPIDVALLQGYKRLAQLAVDEERVLLLPQTGLTGWLQLAFGAKGMGAGPFSSSHAFKEHVERTGGGGTKVERYFEPALLHSVDRSVHEVLLKQSDYNNCDCPYCPSLHSNTVWNHDLAQLHYLHVLGRLAGIGASSGRTIAAGIRRTVRTAAQESGKQLLPGANKPQHLPVWDQLL